MNFVYTSIAAATSIFTVNTSYAALGEPGKLGDGSFVGGEYYGSPGEYELIDGSVNSSGGKASDVTGRAVNVGSVVGPQLIVSGSAGGNAVSSSGNSSLGGGNTGGSGGGSVFGGIAIGGAGGYSSSINNYGVGGDGGIISNNTITVVNTNLIGGNGGLGVGGYATGGSGGGGQGGGSVLGGLSIGGAGSDTNGAPGDGGAGGIISNNTIMVAGSTLKGAKGGGGGSYNSDGGNAVAGQGGGSVFGGISIGGAAGYSQSLQGSTLITQNPSISRMNGGDGGEIFENEIIINDSFLIGGEGGSLGASALGNGGGSVFGGLSIGGEAGKTLRSSYTNGGSGGDVFRNTIAIKNSILTGANGGAGNVISGSSGGASVFGGFSVGGISGDGSSLSSNGGIGGDVYENSILLMGVTLNGSNADGSNGLKALNGGHGGGSVFGGISSGGGAQQSNVSLYNGSTSIILSTESNGGFGGNISNNSIKLIDTVLDGGKGGAGDVARVPYINLNSGGGAGGQGGGSVFGGLSIGGVGGVATFTNYDPSNFTDRTTATANGGRGGNVINNKIELHDTKLNSAPMATGGIGGGAGVAGQRGGSVFGGISIGGAGGLARTFNVDYTELDASGGNGGNISGNSITLSGETYISGDVYGGLSQGGAKGNAGNNGKGGLVTNNTITIIGDKVSISGSLFGGVSIDGGNSMSNSNQDATYSRYYAGNTLQIQSGHFELNGELKNFQYYNWLLPENEFNEDKIIDVKSGQPVDINNTIHRVDVKATGNTLDGGDYVTLISLVTGEPNLNLVENQNSRIYIEQGFFIVYDAEMVVKDNGVAGNSLVLNVLGVNDGNPDGNIHPESEELLKGRIAQLALVDQGADMISDGISYARASLRRENANIFTIVEGGNNKYKNGGASTLKLNDFKFTVGAAKAIELDNKSVGMIAAFAEHGNANYNSYNYFDYFGDTRGSGKLRYSGAGLMFHMDVAGTDISQVQKKPNIFDDKYGLYVDAALRVGHMKVDFHSADMANGAGVEASYNTKSRYASAMAGVGYVWTLDEKQAVDLYGRFTFSRLNGKDIQVVDEQMYAGAAHSKRMRLGARYGYTYSDKVTPYAGVAFERNFTGDVTGSAYGLTIKENSLKGNTGIVEAGVMVKPKGAKDPFSMHLGVQGSFGQRKGVTAGVRARYVF